MKSYVRLAWKTWQYNEGEVAGSYLLVVGGLLTVTNYSTTPIILQFVSLQFPFLTQFCTLERLGHEVGWNYRNVVATLEARRKIKAKMEFKKRKADRVSVMKKMIVCMLTTR